MQTDANFFGAVGAERQLHFIAIVGEVLAWNDGLDRGINAFFSEHFEQYVAFHLALCIVCPLA